jgi:hypothetical protein
MVRHSDDRTAVEGTGDRAEMTQMIKAKLLWIACLFGIHKWWAVPGGGEWICAKCGKAAFRRDDVLGVWGD